MARTEQEILEQIDKLEAARKVTRARNGYAHYSERINYLKGELALLRAQKAQSEEERTAAAVGEHWDMFNDALGLPSVAELKTMKEEGRVAWAEAELAKPRARVCNGCGQRYYTPWSPSDNSHCDTCNQPAYRKRFMAFD